MYSKIKCVQKILSECTFLTLLSYSFISKIKILTGRPYPSGQRRRDNFKLVLYLRRFESDSLPFKKTIRAMKTYKTPEEKIDAMRQAIELRQKWEKAVRDGATREEMEKMGLKSPIIID